eukprot:GFUD01031082.1.p1 GENE.GFUD01031082.1~~GFUD01031082.1.p1  ORF type:complete len:350 (+),score=63.55 GFUD01031082.1:158-1207(+)
MRGCLRKIVRKLRGNWVGQILLLIVSSLFWLWILSVIVEWRWGDRHNKLITIVHKIEPTLVTTLADQDNVKNIMEDRINIMKDACRKHGLDTPGPDPLHQVKSWEYFINWEHSLVWCNVFKSASTSWMYIFNVLSGYSPKFLKKTRKIPLTLAREKYPRPSVDQLKEVLKRPNVTSVIIARNPFERLVSAYKDKIFGALPGSFHDKMRRKITQEYRHVNIPRSRKLQPELIPSFKEFVQYILDENSKQNTPEMHWAPVYSFCNPCQVNLNLIAKFETLSADTENVLSKIKATENLNVEKKNSAKDGKSSHKVTKMYLKELGKELYEKLVQLYVIDFDIFGYQVPEYKML